jgi:very-short-patch-repair endonuclease
MAEIAEAQHGLVARRQLSHCGMGRGAIDSRIERGQLHQVHRGVYAVGHGLLTSKGRLMAAVLACGPGAVLSHRSAGEAWRMVPPGHWCPEVTAPSCRRRPGIRVHRATRSRDETSEDLSLPVTSVSRTLFDLASVLSKRELERALHEAEVRQLTDRLSLPDLLERYPRRHGAANLRALLAAKTPPGVTRSDLEEDFAVFLDAHGLPRPRFNATLPIRGRLLEPDCMWVEQRLLVELDGRAVHGTERAFESDRQRDRILLAEGWRSTRVTWRQLRDEPAAIAADLRQLLRRRTGPPTL